MTKLGEKMAATASAAPSRFDAALSGALPMRDITIPILNLPAKLQIIGHGDGQRIEADVWRRMRDRDMPYNAATLTNYEAERALLVVAAAVREPVAPFALFGTVDEWDRVPSDIVVDVFRMYADLREELDPVAQTLAQDDLDEIRSAISKKNSPYLRSFGCRKLATYLLTSVDPPASSPTPRSSPSESSGDT